MRVRSISGGTMCPYGARLLNGHGGLFAPGELVCHCLLVESDDGLVLVDTGLGLDDLAHPVERLGRLFLAATRPKRDPEHTAARAIERLGYRRDDVRHIVVTHLDLDHAGGIADFPRAAVHVFRREHAAAMSPETMMERDRYRPVHWAHGPDWRLHDVTAGERWFGFERARPIERVGDDLLLVPLHGHTRGHCGVAVRTPEGWLLHAGDAYFFHAETDPVAPRCTPALALFQNIVEVDREARLANQARLRELVRAHGSEVRVVCAHSPEELARETARQAKGASPEGTDAAAAHAEA